MSIEALKKTTEFLFNEVKDVKDDMKHLKKDMKVIHEVSDAHSKKMSEMYSRLNEVEQFKRRWNLRLYGLAGQSGEDVKAVKRKVYLLCSSSRAYQQNTTRCGYCTPAWKKT